MLKKLRNLSVKARLAGAFGLLSIMLVVGAVGGLGVMSQQNNAMQQSYEQAVAPALLLGSLRSKSLLNFTVLGEAAHMVDQPDQMKQKVADAKKIEAEIAAINKQLKAVPMSEKRAAAYKDFLSMGADYHSAIADIYSALNDGYKGTSAMIEMQLRPQLMMRMSMLDKLIKAQGVHVQEINQAQLDRYHMIRWVVLASLIFGLAIAAVVAIVLIRSLGRTLKHLEKVAYAISEGKLGHAIRVERDDELGCLLNAFRVMDERLGGIVGEVRKGSDAVGAATQQIRVGNEGLSERTQEQASSLVETASAMEEMTSTVKQNADNASQANELAHKTREQAERGGEVVREAVSAMAEVEASSSKISDIVRLIEEIATQTNLLALNAAVEAARAGEQGRGFAVVAGEVRNLAQRSSDAAKEIKALIVDSEARVKTGSSLVNQSGEVLSGIVDSVKKVADIVAEITTASHEQSVGIDQVSHAVTQIEEMTQQNSSLVEEASEASRSLQEQAEELSRQIGFFHLADDAAKAPRHVVDADRAAAAVFAAVRKSGPESKKAADKAAEVDDWEEF